RADTRSASPSCVHLATTNRIGRRMDRFRLASSSRVARGALVAAAGLVVGFAATAVRAQDDGAVPSGASGAVVVPAASASTTAPKLVPPKLVTYADPIYPPEELAKGNKSEVVLELTVDATGKVTEAKVSKSGGDAFDVAALAAAPKLVFDPATRDGKPIPAKIPFRYAFDFKDVPKPM